jgi:hypothetical protein
MTIIEMEPSKSGEIISHRGVKTCRRICSNNNDKGGLVHGALRGGGFKVDH